MGTQMPLPPGDRIPQFSAHSCCGQMAGWIKMPLCREIGLGPCGIAFDGDPAPHPQRGGVAPIFGPCSLWPNGWMDQDATWYGGRPRPRPHCSGWEPSSPSQKGHSPPNVGPYLLWPNGWVDQDTTQYGGRPRPRPQCVRWGPSSP